MININKVKQKVVDDVTTLVSEKFNVPKKEVQIKFASDGEMKVTIVPETFLKTIGVNVEVTTNEKEKSK